MLFFGQDDKKKNNLKKRNLWTPPLKPEFFPPLLRKLGCAEDVPWEDSSGRTEYRVKLPQGLSIKRQQRSVTHFPEYRKQSGSIFMIS